MYRESRCILRHFKIIKRARQNYLFDQWKASNPSKEAIIELAKNGIARFQKKHDEEEDQDKKKMYFDHLTKANAAVQGKFIEKNHCCHQQDSFYKRYPEKSQIILQRFYIRNRIYCQ